MKRILYSLLALVVLLSLTLAMAVPALAVVNKTIYIHQAEGTLPTSNTAWHFIINQIDTTAHVPPSIHVVWSDNSNSDIPLDKVTDHYVAQYLDSTPAHQSLSPMWDSFVDAYLVSASIYPSFSGQFNYSGPNAPVPEMPAVALLGIGVASIGAFVYIQRRRTVTTG